MIRANGRILVVEDDPDWVETYRSVLAVDDYEVVAVGDIAAARALLAQDSDWDVIILDMKLRGKDGPNDGLDLISELRVRAPFAKVIMVTAFAERRPIQDAFQAGVYDFIEKPGCQHPALLQAKVHNAWLQRSTPDRDRCRPRAARRTGLRLVSGLWGPGLRG